MLTLNEHSLNSLFSALKNKKLAVLGDFCLDAYYFLDDSLSEISIETGLPTEAVKCTRFTPGGAGNVAANLTAIGVSTVYGLGVVGDDLFGHEYLTILSSRQINTDYMVVQENNWQTCVYTKRYRNEDESPRIDIGNFNRLDDQSAQALLDNLESLLPVVDLILVNQQLVNGLHTPYFRENLQRIILSNPGKLFLLDSRDYMDDYQGAWRKLNDREAAVAAGLSHNPDNYRHIDQVRRAARILSKRWKKPVFITRGDRGSLAQDGDATFEIPGLHFLSKIDTVGAGDSFLAGLAAGLAVDFPYDQALILATFAAGVTIQQRFQTGTAGSEDIRILARKAEFRLEPEKAESIDAAEYLPDTEIEIIRPVAGKTIRFALFDHDGTISTLREGWEAFMEPVMIQAILGQAHDRVSKTVFNQITRDVRECIDKTTGMQTLQQMVELIELIKHWDFVPHENILEPAGYKRIYQDELGRLIQKRLDKIKRGETTVDDFTIKGAIPFLKKLRDRNINLFLASGSDETDVREEIAFMGYADLFNGGIFGAASSIIVEPKKKVLQTILNEIGPENTGQIITFGDGPVEMRATWNVGGTCVGVAANEVRRFGLNQHKRKRLILAGADIVISDFTQHERLFDLLFQH